MPTALMEKVSRYLEQQDEPVSRNTVEKQKLGAAEYVRQAMDALAADDFVDEVAGPRNARLLRSTKPYRTSSDLVATSSDELPHDLVTSSVPLRHDEGEVTDEDAEWWAQRAREATE
jgi:hypothetical protein